MVQVELRDKRFVAKMSKWLRIVETWPHGVTFPNLRNGEILATEFVENVRSVVAHARARIPA